jgi:hypothetical protein
MYLHFHIIFFLNLPKNWLILKNGIFGGFFGDFFLYLMHAPLRRSISGNLEQCGTDMPYTVGKPEFQRFF